MSAAAPAATAAAWCAVTIPSYRTEGGEAFYQLKVFNPSGAAITSERTWSQFETFDRSWRTMFPTVPYSLSHGGPTPGDCDKRRARLEQYVAQVLSVSALRFDLADFLGVNEKLLRQKAPPPGAITTGKPAASTTSSDSSTASSSASGGSGGSGGYGSGPTSPPVSSPGASPSTSPSGSQSDRKHLLSPQVVPRPPPPRPKQQKAAAKAVPAPAPPPAPEPAVEEEAPPEVMPPPPMFAPPPPPITASTAGLLGLPPPRASANPTASAMPVPRVSKGFRLVAGDDDDENDGGITGVSRGGEPPDAPGGVAIAPPVMAPPPPDDPAPAPPPRPPKQKPPPPSLTRASAPGNAPDEAPPLPPPPRKKKGGPVKAMKLAGKGSAASPTPSRPGPAAPASDLRGAALVAAMNAALVDGEHQRPRRVFAPATGEDNAGDTETAPHETGSGTAPTGDTAATDAAAAGPVAVPYSLEWWQAVTGMAFGVFLAVHVLCLSVGAVAGGTMLEVTLAISRWLYQTVIGELALVTVLSAHIGIGVYRWYQRSRGGAAPLVVVPTADSPALTYHRFAALVLVLVVPAHVVLMRVAPPLSHGADAEFVHIVLGEWWFPLPLIGFGVTLAAAVVHASYGVIATLRALGFTRSPHWQSVPLPVRTFLATYHTPTRTFWIASTLVGLLALLSLSGVLFGGASAPSDDYSSGGGGGGLFALFGSAPSKPKRPEPSFGPVYAFVLAYAAAIAALYQYTLTAPAAAADAPAAEGGRRPKSRSSRRSSRRR